MLHVIAYDFGTTGVKSCLIELDEGVKILAGEYESYDLTLLPNGGAEQDCDQWWNSMCITTKKLLQRTGMDANKIDGISFCTQMQGLILVDQHGRALRPAMSYMDQRATAELKKFQAHGLTVSGVNIRKLIKSLIVTHAASTSVKDPLWKYKWVQQNEPEVFAKVHKWLDVKEYLVCRCTGEFIMTYDSAYSTFLFDSRKGKNCWHKGLCKAYGVNMDHLARLTACTDVAGELTSRAAKELGLIEGIKVYAGGGDATLIPVGAGSTKLGDTHIYSGTSGWVGTVLDRQKVDIFSMIAGIVGAMENRYMYFAEMETAGKCFEWVKEHLVCDEIDAYLNKVDITQSKEAEYESLYDYMSHVITEVQPGSGGVIFTPWLHGNRCPFEDPMAAGMFFNIQLDTKKRQMLRAVLEGICFHLRWMLECEEKKTKTSKEIRFVGGGALSTVTCQMLADITGHTIQTVEYTKDVGAIGAAMLVAVGSGQLEDLSRTSELIPVKESYEPNMDHKKIYDRNFEVFKELYNVNKKQFQKLNAR